MELVFWSFLHVFLVLKPNALETAQKIENTFNKCVLKFDSASISRTGLLILSTKVKIVVQYTKHTIVFVKMYKLSLNVLFRPVNV